MELAALLLGQPNHLLDKGIGIVWGLPAGEDGLALKELLVLLVHDNLTETQPIGREMRRSNQQRKLGSERFKVPVPPAPDRHQPTSWLCC